MDLQQFLQLRSNQEQVKPIRDRCNICLHPRLTCYCKFVRRFDPKITFVILIHWKEAKRRVATGRMSHLFLEHSLLFDGYNYSHDSRVNALLENSAYHCAILFPGTESKNISLCTEKERAALFPPDKKLVLFVIDGTWTNARKTLQRSKNLRTLPRICFEPSRPSLFRLRKQPRAFCLSTIEAIHQTIELLGPQCGFDLAARQHDQLLYAFQRMEDQEIAAGQSLKLKSPKKNC